MLQPLFEWMYGIGVYKSSIYLGPGINLVHLVAMCTFMGALLMVDLRLLGAGLTSQPVKQVARSAQPWFEFPEGVVRYATQPVDLMELVQLWRDRLIMLRDDDCSILPAPSCR